MTRKSIADLYREAWTWRIERCPEQIEPEATPIIAFGNWRSAKLVTAALNPSEREFRDQAGRVLLPDHRRFLHWPEDGELTPERLTRALELSENYFRVGNGYKEWFNGYERFFETLGVSFVNGTACHTDYISPFATKYGIGKCGQRVRKIYQNFGLNLWNRCLKALPSARLLFGHGAGWRRVAEETQWECIETEFDKKGGEARTPRPFLRFTWIALEASHRLPAFWWIPNRGEPLTWLTRHESGQLGKVILHELKKRHIEF